MAYVLPQVQVFQELNAVPTGQIEPQPAFISGGHAQLIRESEADEKADGLLGYYEDAAETCYTWPNRPAGGVVDTDYTRVHIDSALLRYFEDLIGAGDTISTVASTVNKVRASATNWVANGATYPRDSDLKERDVQVGDIAKIRAVVGGDSYELITSVTGFEADAVASSVAAASGDSGNQTTQSAPTATSSYTGDTDYVNCVDVDSIDQSSYDGLDDGDVNETYVVTVIQGSAGGDATTATLRVASVSGNDDVAEVTPAAFGSPTTIGTRGVTVTWDDQASAACSLSADNNSVSDIDFLVGQAWTISVGQAFTAPTATSGGTYTGAKDVTYIIEVTRGGTYSIDTSVSPQVTVTTNLGTDASGPTNVTASGGAIAAGTQGVTVSFDGTGLRKGDIYLIAAAAETDGPYRTLILANNFASEVQANGATEVDLTLYIKKDIEVSENRAESPGTKNWTTSATEVCLNSGVTALDSSWTDSGVPEPLPVFSLSSAGYGQAYVTARYWLSDLCAGIEQISDIAQLDSQVSGKLHPDNPLKWALSKALANNNGVDVSYVSVCDPSDTDAWLTVLELADGRRDTYGFVPLTRNKTVLDTFLAHVQNQATPEQASWRTVWTNLLGDPEKVIVDSDASSDGEEVLATLEDDPDTSGTQYTYLQVPAGNGEFVSNSVEAGDIVRYLYTADGFGGFTWSEFVVDAVINEDTIRLVAPGHTTNVATAQKIEIWRNLTDTELSEELALTDGFSNRRLLSTWPDTIGSGGYTFDGYHLNAALAALASGVVPQQGLTNVAINGFDDLSRTVGKFNRSQLDTMAEGGVWIVTQDRESGEVFTRHAITTGDQDDLNQREESITRNLDSISFFFADLLAPYIGTANVTDSLIDVLRAEIHAGIETLRGRNFTEKLGGQIVDATLTELRRHASLKDRLVVIIELDLPEPLNVAELHLVV